MSYHLRRLRLHGMIERIPKSHRCRFTDFGLRTALFCTRAWARIFNMITGFVLAAHGFYTQYAHARDIGLDCLADRVLEIAETPLVAEKRVRKADGSVEITTADALDRSRLTVDSLKWYLYKLAPKKYGDKIDG
jgi:hypothetical protein